MFEVFLNKNDECEWDNWIHTYVLSIHLHGIDYPFHAPWVLDHETECVSHFFPSFHQVKVVVMDHSKKIHLW
jgi:hypothetical protein